MGFRPIACLVAMALVALAPIPPSGAEPCPSGFGQMIGGRGACVEVTIDDPGGFIPDPLLPDTRPCEEAGYSGVAYYWRGGWGEVCFVHGMQNPTIGGTPLIKVSLPSCGPGTDPRVDISGGWVFVCVIVVNHFGPATLPEIDLEPCPGGFDPAIRQGESEVRVCVVLIP